VGRIPSTAECDSKGESRCFAQDDNSGGRAGPAVGLCQQSAEILRPAKSAVLRMTGLRKGRTCAEAVALPANSMFPSTTLRAGLSFRSERQKSKANHGPRSFLRSE
jgi:hypothetical protein